MEKKHLNMAIGNRIKIARERAGLTQEQLAEKIGKSTQFVSVVERGVAGPSLETITSICDSLDTSCDWLVRGLEPSPSAWLIAARLSALDSRQLAAVDRMITDLLLLIKEGGQE